MRWDCAAKALVCLVALLATTASADETRHADVVIYGSTPGGFCAAIAAAREGASVILLEPTDHVGGLNTGGLSFSDSNQTVRSSVMGLFDEWHRRIEEDYAARGIELPYKVSEKNHAKWTYEPHVAMRVTRQMLDEAKVTLLTKRYLRSVTKDGTAIISLVTSDGTFTGKVFIDASYEGDLLAAAGVSWTIGREGRDEFGESLAGKQYPKRTMTIDGFDAQGSPLPMITTTDAGPTESGDRNVMTYSFRLCLTADPDNKVPMPTPANYDPARFEVVRRYLETGRNVRFDLYPLPGDKFDGNNAIAGQFSLGLVGGGKDWCEADEAGRKAIWEAHKQYTLEFFHFLTTDPAVPEEIKKKYIDLGLCKDEFAAYGHFSPALYVREGRRMRGMYVLSENDITKKPTKPDPIVVSSFPIDSHDCQRVAHKEGGVVNEGTIFPVRVKGTRHGYAYHVPYRSVLPKPEECTNLLVPVALSCTHVGISSIRVEPTWMILGQSAGIAAALAAEEESTVQGLSYSLLRERLLAQDQVLELPANVPSKPIAGTIDVKSLSGVVLDDADATLAGRWDRSTNFRPHVGQGYLFSGEPDVQQNGDGTASATFRFKAPRSGRYRLLMAYSPHESRATRVPVVVTSGPHRKELTVDQAKPLPAGEAFRQVATVELDGDAETAVTISNAETKGFVILDALRFVLVK
ncbi:FAD-dependent oxidoreductase [Kolteria novifilia]|uniref:FAD-dependent oxidoreductase n=1 Tax=Kolteria novifilia TaxID=2527975 RepID=UPI003AF3BD4F